MVGAEDATVEGEAEGVRDGKSEGICETEGLAVGAVVSILKPDSKIISIKSSMSLSACCLVSSSS